MQPIDFIFRFDPQRPEVRELPGTAEEARRIMEAGNRLFAEWTESCSDELDEAQRAKRRFVVPCDFQDLGVGEGPGEVAAQSPFAVLLSCSDARVPTEMIFAQVRNNLFVVRVAGNVLATECLGSIEYATHAMKDSLRMALVLGHTNCGAVSAAVNTYLNPWDYLEKIPSPAVRSIVDQILTPVRKSAAVLETIWGADAVRMPHYKEVLTRTAIFVNAAQGAYRLRQALEQEGSTDVGVYYGVFDLATHRIWSLPEHQDSKHRTDAPADARLAAAPTNINEFEETAVRMALRLTRQARDG